MERSSLAVALSPLLSQLAMSPAPTSTAVPAVCARAGLPLYKPRMSSAAATAVAAARSTNQSLRCLTQTAGSHRASIPILAHPSLVLYQRGGAKKVFEGPYPPVSLRFPEV